MKTLNELTETLNWRMFNPDWDNIILTEDVIAEMARIDPSLSGTRVVIFVSSRQYVKGKHWARIKVSNVYGKYSADDNFSVSISKKPIIVAGKRKIKESDLDDVYDWIKLNYEVLMKYWNDQYTDVLDFSSKLKQI